MLKTIGILLGTLIVLLTGFHFWFVNNAENIIEDLVDSKSNGKLKLKVRNMKFNYLSKKIELQDVIFYSTDTANQNTSYSFKVDNIRLQAKAILPIVFRKELRIDSLFLEAPDVEVIRLRPVVRTATRDIKDISVPEEMGRVYNSIQDAINILEVNRFEFDKGKFTLINSIDPDSKPFIITNLHFHIDNLQLDSTKKDKVLFSDQIVLRTRDQDITFPDGLHRLAFSSFRINVGKQLIEFDSCTITGRNPVNRSAFSVYFDTLKLINLDFKSLYQSELIRADSVYCLNPDFKITLESKIKPDKKEVPNIDSLVQQFTGDMQLKYVGVINADIDITTYKNNIPNTFSSSGNNFEMRGLTIDHHLTKPVSVEGFAMSIRDYENFLKDSTFTLRFDSIHIRENKILLSNFSLVSSSSGTTRNVQVSQFELDGLSWSQLLFNKTLKANEAVLYNPKITYTQTAARTRIRKDKNIFQSLGGLNDVMELDRLRIINGEIHMKMSNNVSLDLQNAYLFIKSQVLLDSKKYRNIEQSVQDLRFGKALLRIKGLLVELQDAKFTGFSDQLSIRYARAYTGRQTISANAHDILLNEILYDEEANTINAKGVSWQQARLEVNANPKKPKKADSELAIHLEDIDVYKTTLQFNGNKFEMTAFLDKMSATEINESSKINIKGFAALGRDLKLTGNDMKGSVSSFSISDQQPSNIRKISFQQNNNGNSIDFNSPGLDFIADLNSLIQGNSRLQSLRIQHPQLVMTSSRKDTVQNKGSLQFPELAIGNLEIDKPMIVFEKQQVDSFTRFTWQGGDNKIRLQNILSSENELKIGRVNGDLSGIELINYGGRKISSGEGQLDINAGDIVLSVKDSLKWSGIVEHAKIRNLRMDSIGKKKTNIVIRTADAANLKLNSEWLKDLALMVKKNTSVSLKHLEGSMRDNKNDFSWYNFSFDNAANTASIDSFNYQPVLSRDSFVAASKWQTDYMTIHTGRVFVKGVDLDRYMDDSTVRLGVITIQDPFFTSFRDKRPPFHAGIYKPLASRLIQNIPFPISIDTIKIQNGTVLYTELNDKTNVEGTIPVTRMSGDIFPIRNFGLKPSDSLRIRLNGYLLDSAWIRLRTRESYLDSLNGFLLTVRMRPRDLQYLNKVLIPLSSIKIKSGYLDTLSMRAVGRDDLSLGEIRMYYHDLRVQFLKSGKETKKGLLSGLMTFIANSFVIARNNKNRVGTVYFPRLQDRSFINYYVKMTLSGVATSIGAKKNKKMLRKYQRELNKKQLPPIDFDLTD